VQLLERTCIRIGNERYAEENDSFGLTTMRNRHVKVSGARVEFQFRVRRSERVGITHVAAAVREASKQLGNTPAICRKSYVHPRVLDPGTWQGAAAGKRNATRSPRDPARAGAASESSYARR
jgi:DNA topoisomerase IB